MDTIISSIITGIVAITTCLITQGMSNRRTLALLEYRLSELQKQVEKHNSIVERTYKLEETSAIQEEKIKVCNHRIDDLEKKNG